MGVNSINFGGWGGAGGRERVYKVTKERGSQRPQNRRQVRFHMENKVNYDNDDETQHIFFIVKVINSAKRKYRQPFVLSRHRCSGFQTAFVLLFFLFFLYLGQCIEKFLTVK